jgi:hypothetical protein
VKFSNYLEIETLHLDKVFGILIFGAPLAAFQRNFSLLWYLLSFASPSVEFFFAASVGLGFQLNLFMFQWRKNAAATSRKYWFFIFQEGYNRCFGASVVVARLLWLGFGCL